MTAQTRLQYLKDETWVRNNEQKLRELLPPIWTHEANVQMLQVGFSLKLIGVDWRSTSELVNVMAYLTSIGIFEVKPPHMRRAPHSIFE
jgi:hypothetical protein